MHSSHALLDLSPSRSHAPLSVCACHCYSTGDIKALEHLPQLTSVNFKMCNSLTGESPGGRFLSELRTSPQFLKKFLLSEFYANFLEWLAELAENSWIFFALFKLPRSLPPTLLACQSSSHSHFLVILYASVPTGKFEDFKALGALLELSIGGYGCKIDCKKALEVLPTMPWAAQIQKLDLSRTDVEGTAECSFVFGAPVRFFWKNFLL